MTRQNKRCNAQGVAMGYSESKTKIMTIILDVIFWILSIFVLIFSVGAFAVKGGVVSGVILLVTAIIINPIIYKFICKKIHITKRWACAVVCLVGFFVGILSMPTPQNVNDKASDKTIVTSGDIKESPKDTSADNQESTDKTTAKNEKDEESEKDNKKSEEFFTDDVIKGSLPEIDNAIVEKLMEAGYTIEHATEIQSILNTCGITSIEIYFQTGEAEKGLNAMSCYANGSKENKSRFTVTTEDGVPFYVGFLNEDLYDKDQGGFIMKYTDVHIPETKVDMDTYTTLQVLAVKAVEGCLNYPSTANFKELSWGIGRSDDKYKIIGEVSAKNGFGVKDDISFGVWFKKVNNSFIVEGITLNGVRVK